MAYSLVQLSLFYFCYVSMQLFKSVVIKFFAPLKDVTSRTAVMQVELAATFRLFTETRFTTVVRSRPEVTGYGVLLR